MDWSDAFMSRSACAPLCTSLLCVCTRHVSLMPGNIQHTALQKYRVAGEDIHLVTIAEKMQPALLVTAHLAKKARKRKPEAEKAAMKKALEEPT